MLDKSLAGCTFSTPRYVFQSAKIARLKTLPFHENCILSMLGKEENTNYLLFFVTKEKMVAFWRFLGGMG